MDLKVTLTLSDQLLALLEDKLPNLGRRVEKALTSEIDKKVRDESCIKVELIDGDTTVREHTHRMAARQSPLAEAVAAPEPKAGVAKEGAEEKPRNLGVEIREIIHRTRQRIEGEDYQTNTGSDNYKLYHRAVGNQLKQIAVTLGYDKPSLIDDPEKVDCFAAEADALVVDENGNITTPTPF